MGSCAWCYADRDAMYERRGYVPVGESDCILYDKTEIVRQVQLSKQLLI